jgi:hypothetical protein
VEVPTKEKTSIEKKVYTSLILETRLRENCNSDYTRPLELNLTAYTLQNTKTLIKAERMHLKRSIQLYYVQSAISPLIFFCFKTYFYKKKELIQGYKISLGSSGLDKYSLRYRVSGS